MPAHKKVVLALALLGLFILADSARDSSPASLDQVDEHGHRELAEAINLGRRGKASTARPRGGGGLASGGLLQSVSSFSFFQGNFEELGEAHNDVVDLGQSVARSSADTNKQRIQDPCTAKGGKCSSAYAEHSSFFTKQLMDSTLGNHGSNNNMQQMRMIARLLMGEALVSVDSGRRYKMQLGNLKDNRFQVSGCDNSDEEEEVGEADDIGDQRGKKKRNGKGKSKNQKANLKGDAPAGAEAAPKKEEAKKPGRDFGAEKLARKAAEMPDVDPDIDVAAPPAKAQGSKMTDEEKNADRTTECKFTCRMEVTTHFKSCPKWHNDRSSCSKCDAGFALLEQSTRLITSDESCGAWYVKADTAMRMLTSQLRSFWLTDRVRLCTAV